MLKAILQVVKESTLTSAQVSDQVMRLLFALKGSQQSALNLMAELGLSPHPTFRKNYLHPSLAAQLIEMVHPDTPRARNQKYCLAKRGEQLSAKKDV